MQITKRDWHPTKRGIIEGVIAGAVLWLGSVVSAAIIERWADLKLTQLERVAFFVGLPIVISISWVMFAWGWRILYPAQKQDDAARQVWRGIAEALEPFRDKRSAARQSVIASPKPPKERDWTPFEREERAKQVAGALTFIDGEVDVMISLGRKLLGRHENAIRDLEGAPSYIGDLASYRDATRKKAEMIERIVGASYRDISAPIDAQNFSALISSVDNFIRTLERMLGLPSGSKPEILRDLLGPRIASFEAELEGLVRWRNAARQRLIAMREGDGA